jgi:hypothetical protein
MVRVHHSQYQKNLHYDLRLLVGSLLRKDVFFLEILTQSLSCLACGIPICSKVAGPLDGLGAEVAGGGEAIFAGGGVGAATLGAGLGRTGSDSCLGGRIEAPGAGLPC